VPVWHALSEGWRETHDLVVVGIAQEQHKERCDLWARWQGIGWPILWDPFNLTESRAVPNVYALDEAGIVRAIRPDPATFVEDFLERDFGVVVSRDPRDSAARPPRVMPRLVELADPTLDDDAVGLWQSLSDVLFGAESDLTPVAALDLAIERLRAWVEDDADDATARFRLGVALRLRHDGDGRQPGDFQAALDAWSAALAARPNEYIWRRRIQQYGPSLDKPYPFYPWMGEAVAELTARGEPTPVLTATLTQAEQALPRRQFEGADEREPDPEGELLRDEGQWLELETAVAPHTDGRGESVRVHLTFRPRLDRNVHWNNEAGGMAVWLQAPEGWTLDRQLTTLPVDPATPVSAEARALDVELRRPADASGTLSGYVLFNACEDVTGVCTYLRRDFSVTLGG
jgi:hypothetical protein